jgi:hypothetical protein
MKTNIKEKEEEDREKGIRKRETKRRKRINVKLS